MLKFNVYLFVLFIALPCIVAVKHKVLPEICPEIVTREDWGARRPLEIDYTLIPVKNVIVHHTVSPECKTKTQCSSFLKTTQLYHMSELDYQDIGYNFLVGSDGRIYEGAGWHIQGAHTYGWNSRSLGLAFIGDFSEELPNERQLKAAKNFLECGIELKELSADYKLFGGKQIISTESPGLRLYKEIKKWPHYSKNVA